MLYVSDFQRRLDSKEVPTASSAFERNGDWANINTVESQGIGSSTHLNARHSLPLKCSVTLSTMNSNQDVLRPGITNTLFLLAHLESRKQRKTICGL